MDLIADMLMKTLPAVAERPLRLRVSVRPMVQRWSRLPVVGRSGTRASRRSADRAFVGLSALARAARIDFDVFHIVDHSYAHLVRVLPADRTIVTCNDLDAMHAALPGWQQPSDPARLLARRVLDGLGRAAHVACISHATAAELLATGRIDPSV